ncbi:uncharacterized protein LOC144166436 [Haemaphysalis longicornis]
MVGSERAASAANAGRGNSFYAVPKDYRIILPQIPSGEEMNRTVVLHCDTKGRPYRIEDFRQPLKDLGVVQEASGIGAFQMSHVWLVKFRTDDAKKIVDAGHLDRVCLVVDPNRQEIRVKLHWVSFDVTNDTIRRIFGAYGEVKDVTSERWRVEDFENADSTTRFVCLVLREGVTLDCLPHQLRLGKGTALVVVPGRAPMCLRCNTAGHIRRECRVPKCGECHGFGHEQAECTRSYAGAARRDTDDEHTDLVMDEEEAENAASAFSNEVKEDADVKATTQSVKTLDELHPLYQALFLHLIRWKEERARSAFTIKSNGPPLLLCAFVLSMGALVMVLLRCQRRLPDSMRFYPRRRIVSLKTLSSSLHAS